MNIFAFFNFNGRAAENFTLPHTHLSSKPLQFGSILHTQQSLHKKFTCSKKFTYEIGKLQKNRTLNTKIWHAKVYIRQKVYKQSAVLGRLYVNILHTVCKKKALVGTTTSGCLVLVPVLSDSRRNSS